MYIYYTRSWGPTTDFFDQILSIAPSANVINNVDIALTISLLSVLSGILVSGAVLGCSKQKWDGALRLWKIGKLNCSRESDRRLQNTVIFAVLILAPFMMIENQIPRVIEYITSDLGEFAKIELRRESGGSSYYIFNLLLAGILPFIAFSWIAKREYFSQRAIIGIAFIAIVLVGKAASLSKAPPAIFLLQSFIAIKMSRSLYFGTYQSIGFLFLSTALFSLMATIAIPNIDETDGALSFLFYRIFMIPNEGLLEYFSAIPAVIDYSWGSQFSWLSGLFKNNQTLPTYWVVAELHRGVSGSTTTVMFIGDAWADFSWLGVVAASFILGVITRWIDIITVVRRGKNPYTVAGICLAHFGIFTALSTALQTAMLTGGLLLVAPLIWWFDTGRNKSTETTNSVTTIQA
jgi:hypothetical protein